MNKTKSNPISLTSLELEQIGTAIKNLTNILNKYDVKEPSEVSQKEFDEAFNELLKGSTKRYIDPETGKISKKKTTWIILLNSEGSWLLDYDTDPKHSYFFYFCNRVDFVLRNKFHIQNDSDMKRLMKSLIETQYKMKNTNPYSEFLANSVNYSKIL